MQELVLEIYKFIAIPDFGKLTQLYIDPKV